ncbi:MAG TPA: lipocalin family protein [Mesorhizobium sp.]|jgi:apolipoprotein D and lipocalin family protein|uniref:lipocalin family protein n=1 Tax=Mesorhizobium sp. TaxID=1871066 RepID=UPI002DDDB041|nr:lipocalin family protein [Mesorhizobium sp.]HEV2503739.1 lipocalin family protein [Mesorhizobium sp.]
MSDVTAVPMLDLKRYLGRWYEICRQPIKWEDEAATDITATYSLSDDGKVRVDNRCFDKEGKPARALGEATPVDGSNSRLKVTFLPKSLRWLPFTSGDYWVLKLDPGYDVALVGTPNHKYLWLLARAPSLPQETRDEYLAEAKRQGFKLAGLIMPQHTGREVTDAMLADR